MRASIEQQTQTSMYSRKDRARQKLNVPISRMPITTQSANTNTGTGTGTGTSASAMIPIQSSTNSTVPSGPFSPITTASITGAVVPGSSPASAGTDDGAAFTYARRWDQTKTMFREDTNKTLNLAQSMTPTKAEESQTRLHISVPRQPRLPKLNLQVPEISVRFEPDSISPIKNSDNHHCFFNNNITTNTPLYTDTDKLVYNSRRVSWSPSQAIPEGYYSKGFTLTSFQRTADRIGLSSFSSTSSPFSSTLSSNTSSPSSASSSTPLKRSNTNHQQRKETLSPFQRLVGRSKSMRIKAPVPFFISADSGNNETQVRTERFTGLYSDKQYPRDPPSKKTLDLCDSIAANAKKLAIDKDMMVRMDNSSAAHSYAEQGVDVANSSKNRPRSTIDMSDVQAESLNPIESNSEHSHPTSNGNLKADKTTAKTEISSDSQKPSITIAAIGNGLYKPLWKHTMTNPEQIRELGLSPQEVQKQETIFELIYTEAEYLDDLKSIHKIFVDELNVKMAESRKKKRFNPDKSDVRLYERLARLLSHIKDLWNGHQSLLRSLQNKQQQETPVVQNIGSVFENFYMFSIYDSYFAQYTTTSRDFQHIITGSSELCIIIRHLLKSPRCKCLTLEGIFLKPIQRLQKYPLFFKDLLSLTPPSDPDYAQLAQALEKHQRELTKIDDRIWIEEHNEMLMDLQQRIKGLPSGFSLVEQHRYLILDGPVHRISVRQPNKLVFGKHGKGSKSESYATSQNYPYYHRHGSSEWRGDGFRPPIARLSSSDDDDDDNTPTLITRPSQMDYHHQHAKPAFPSSTSLSSGSSSSSTHSALTTPISPSPITPIFKMKSRVEPNCENRQQKFGDGLFYTTSPISPPNSATTLHSLSSTPSPIAIPNSATPAALSSLGASTPSKQGVVSQLVSQYSFNLSSSFSNLTGATHSRSIAPSALYLPGIIKNSTDSEAEYHVFIFTDIILWTKRVMSRYHRKEGAPWNFKLVEPISRLTSVSTTSEDNIFLCTSVNTSSASYLVRTEDEIAARMWRTTIPTLVPFHCSRNIKDRWTKK